MDLPDNLLRRAEIAAVEPGTSLRDPVSTALSRELGVTADAPEAPERTAFPIFGSVAPGSLDLTDADLREAEAREDKRRDGVVD